MEDKIINFEGLIYALKKRWKIITLSTIALTLIAGLLGYDRVDITYQARVKIFAGKEVDIQNSYSTDDLNTYSSMINTYVELIKTEDFMNMIIEESDLEVTASQLISGLQFNIMPNAPILEIKYISSSAEVAEEVVQTITDEFDDAVSKIILNTYTAVVDSVKVDTIVSNNENMIIIGLICGVTLGLMMVLAIEHFDDTIIKKEDLENKTSLSILGEISIEGNKEKNNKNKNKKDEKEKVSDIIMESYPESFISEEYRTLKNRLEYSSIDKKVKSLIVTSINSGEGKSTVVSNLAYALSESDKSVIIIDCDLRRPTINKKFNISSKIGLTNILFGKSTAKKAIVRVKDNIHIITSGKSVSNPSAVLASNAMEKLIEELSVSYDYILMDTPPVKNISDAQVLSGKYDGTILVVRAESTKSKDIISGIESLNKVRANILGAVLNCIQREKKDYYEYY